MHYERYYHEHQNRKQAAINQAEHTPERSLAVSRHQDIGRKLFDDHDLCAAQDESLVPCAITNVNPANAAHLNGLFEVHLRVFLICGDGWGAVGRFSKHSNVILE